MTGRAKKLYNDPGAAFPRYATKIQVKYIKPSSAEFMPDLLVVCGLMAQEPFLAELCQSKADSEVPVTENTTQEEANSSIKVLINTPQINLQPAEPGTSSVKPPSPTKHLHKISPIPRLSQVTAKHRIKKTAVLLTSIDNRNALKPNLKKRFQKCKKINKKDDNTKRKFNFESGGGSHDSSSDIDECSNSIKFTTPKEKKGEIKSKKAKKDASQDYNNELLDHICDAYVLCKECSLLQN
ncbi:hypothetical protein AVEN_272697-1 [Araneus ventricosus]|uniref:Uncharacterized protein n=1 Tax=Araneus ventricosus TaxID=182803 RepID=A0A4Y2LAN7_ARAVE|nr:hypothetical protein AVEN_272697-1 [Araneus ventricosus]